jgi:hypothetical protein
LYGEPAGCGRTSSHARATGPPSADSPSRASKDPHVVVDDEFVRAEVRLLVHQHGSELAQSGEFGTIEPCEQRQIVHDA